MNSIKAEDAHSLYSYIVAHDYGNAPNPDYEICTLAICKPVIRRCAKLGDIILGLSPKKDGNHIVYCMVVDEIVPWEEYYNRCKDSADLANRIPSDANSNGDCIWIYQGNGIYQLLQSKSRHTREDNEKSDIVSGKRVLIGRNFWYFGSNKPRYKIYPKDYLKVGRGHRRIVDQGLINEFVDFFLKELEKRGITSSGKYGDYWI